MKPIELLTTKEKFLLKKIKDDINQSNTEKEYELYEQVMDELMLASVKRYQYKK